MAVKELTKEERKERMENVMNLLDAGIQAVLNSEKWQEWLKMQARFYNYSHYNTILIQIQKPNATRVAGFNKWTKEFNRKVKKGEKAIKILAPRFFKQTDEETGEEVSSLAGFKIVNVFDIRQTDGDPLPELCNELQGSEAAARFILERLPQVSDKPIRFDAIQGGAKGYCTPTEIVIKEGISDNQAAKTMVHEYAHHKLHFPTTDKERDHKEIEAESIAFIVCHHYGLQTDDYSFEYLAAWSAGRDKKDIKQLGATIQKTAAQIIDELGEMPIIEADPAGTAKYAIIPAPAYYPVAIQYGSPAPTIDVEYTVDVEPVYTRLALPYKVQQAKVKPHKALQKITLNIRKNKKGGNGYEYTPVEGLTTVTPGLVIYRIPNKRQWNLTHEKSGLFIASLSTKQEALDAAAAAPAIDWTQDEHNVVELAGQEGKDWYKRIRDGEFKKKRAS